MKPAPPLDADLQEVFAGGNVIEAAENLLGLPGVSVPCGFTRQDLPIGVKFIGRPFADDLVLEVAHLFQTLTGWHARRPAL